MNFPNNPTGAIMERKDLEAIARVCIKHDLVVISDEIYGELSYFDKHVSIAEIPGMKERTILINGFSKSYAMTGWRLGYAVGPEEIIRQMIKIHQFCIMCAPVVPGSAFGESGEGFIRISYAYSIDDLKKALARVEDFIKTLK